MDTVLQFLHTSSPGLTLCLHTLHTLHSIPLLISTSSSPSSLSDDASSPTSLATRASLASRRTRTNDTSPPSKTTLTPTPLAHVTLEPKYAPNQQQLASHRNAVSQQPHRCPHRHIRLRHPLRHCRNCRNDAAAARRRRHRDITVLRRQRNARRHQSQNSPQKQRQVESHTT